MKRQENSRSKLLAKKLRPGRDLLKKDIKTIILNGNCPLAVEIGLAHLTIIAALPKQNFCKVSMPSSRRRQPHWRPSAAPPRRLHMTAAWQP